MSSEGFTVRVFLPDGDPSGIRVIDRANWTGRGIVFPRSRWERVRDREDFNQPGVYILVGYSPDVQDELPSLYIGEGDGIRDRINSHHVSRTFWDTGYAFVSTNRSLNKAHIQWIEHALIERAKLAARSHLENGVTPTAPTLSESELADTKGFLSEVLRVLPLLGLSAFERAISVAEAPSSSVRSSGSGTEDELDTIIVPAQREGFERVFLGDNCWWAIRIAGGMLSKIKWIAAYQTAPVSAISHVAPVSHIEPYGEDGKYKIVFSKPATEIKQIPFGDVAKGSMQGPRYTSYAKLVKARKLSDLL